MQLMPGTARRFGAADIWDPAQNIRGGIAYLRFLVERFEGDLRLVGAAYNAWEGAAAKYGNRIPPIGKPGPTSGACWGFGQDIALE